jgi:hypothetical protein
MNWIKRNWIALVGMATMIVFGLVIAHRAALTAHSQKPSSGTVPYTNQVTQPICTPEMVKNRPQDVGAPAYLEVNDCSWHHGTNPRYAKARKSQECDPKGFDGMAQMTGLNSSIQYKCSPEGKWVVNEDATGKANTQGKNWRGETREDFCKENPDGIYSEGNGDMATPCRHEPSFSFTAPKEVGVYKMNTVDAFTVGGTRIATLDSSGKLDIVEPVFWKMVQQHCVAVLNEAHIVHHDREAEGGATFDDRMKWDDQIPEQTLKLRCQ